MGIDDGFDNFKASGWVLIDDGFDHVKASGWVLMRTVVQISSR